MRQNIQVLFIKQFAAILAFSSRSHAHGAAGLENRGRFSRIGLNPGGNSGRLRPYATRLNANLLYFRLTTRISGDTILISNDSHGELNRFDRDKVMSPKSAASEIHRSMYFLM
jgi:hypothetical protein